MKRIALFLLFARLVAAGADLAWQAERPFTPSQAAETMRLPEGLLDALTKPQIRDLIGYLQNPAQVPAPAASPPAQ